jgi:hypothetical protein
MTSKKALYPNAAGRPLLYQGEVMKPRTIRMTDGQAAKLDRLGGGAWVRDKIDKAKEPA